MTNRIAAVAIRAKDNRRIEITSDEEITCPHLFHRTGVGGTMLSDDKWAFTHCPVEGCAATEAFHAVLFKA